MSIIKIIDSLLFQIDEYLSNDTTISLTATQILIKSIPGAEIPSFDKHFSIARNIQLPSLKHNELLIEAEYLSVDPYQRSRMKLWGKDATPLMQGFQIARVIKSTDNKYKIGEYIYCHVAWSTLNIIKSSSVISRVPPDLSTYKATNDDEKLKEFNITDIVNKIPHSYYIGSYGMPGMTAYYGLIHRGEVKKGENVLISGAAGAVGSICGQIAKQLYNCYVVGICGSNEKINWIKNDLLFDNGINYKKYGNNFNKIRERLFCEFPNGIDIYFDNVGGIFTEAVWDVLNVGARVIICGQIAGYNSDNTISNIRPMLHKLIYKEIDIRGILVTNFKKQKKYYYNMAKWILSGKIKVKETIVNGFDNAPNAFCGLFYGKNIGKMVVKCT